MYYICGMNQERSLHFHKYQGTGNDFVLIDNRKGIFPKKDVRMIRDICDRRFGIGADGLILLENDNLADFKMVYYNSDGNESTMCGNGGRCIVAFAKELDLIGDKTTFNAIDGMHEAEINGTDVTLKMIDVDAVKETGKYYFLDTGSPHHVQLVDHLDQLDVKIEGAKLRYGIYGQKGSNINFVEQAARDSFKVRTYERGVEGETLSCGTGVTAVAIAMFHGGKTASTSVSIETRGGHLRVGFEKSGTDYVSIWLSGPAKHVFKGEWDCQS